MAETLRVATFNTELARKGPGLLLRDVRRGDDPQVSAVIDTIVSATPDIIVLQGIDYDLQNLGLLALSSALSDRGMNYPHAFAAPPNAGRMTELDLDGDGKLRGAGDAQGYGRFFGHGAMALLSRYPIETQDIQDFSTLLWRDLPNAIPPQTDTGPFPSAAAMAIQRLSSHGHWIVPVRHPDLGRVHLMTFHASPPVFDGPEDRNGRRNHDEVIFWRHVLDGDVGSLPGEQFVLLGDANLDPHRSDGRSEAIRTLLAHLRLQDPLGDQTTVEWTQTGPLRVDYLLPSTAWQVTASGISKPNLTASRHRLLWADLTR